MRTFEDSAKSKKTVASMIVSNGKKSVPAAEKKKEPAPPAKPVEIAQPSKTVESVPPEFNVGKKSFWNYVIPFLALNVFF